MFYFIVICALVISAFAYGYTYNDVYKDHRDQQLLGINTSKQVSLTVFLVALLILLFI